MALAHTMMIHGLAPIGHCSSTSLDRLVLLLRFEVITPSPWCMAVLEDDGRRLFEAGEVDNHNQRGG